MRSSSPWGREVIRRKASSGSIRKRHKRGGSGVDKGQCWFPWVLEARDYIDI